MSGRSPHVPERAPSSALVARATCPSPAYTGPERRRAGSPLWRLLALMLDEIDYGMLLVTADGRVLHANQVALAEVGGDHALAIESESLTARHGVDAAPLREALDAALARGLRRLLAIGEGEGRISIAVVPLPRDRAGTSAALLVFGKRQVCEELSVQGFARCHGLTPAETGVLKALCAGAPPAEIALRQGVRLSTVRTQIGSIRCKTGAASIRALVRQVAVLPPMINALRGMALHLGDAAGVGLGAP